MNANIDTTRRVWLLVAMAALAIDAQAAPVSDATTQLLGRWRSLSPSNGGIGSMFSFREGGELAFSPGAVVEMAYRLEGDQLVLPASTLNGPELRETFTWLSDDTVSFRSSAPGDPGQVFTRAGVRTNASNPLLGEWLGSREMGGHPVQVTRLIRSDGRLLLLIPFVVEPGHYDLTDGRVRIQLPRRRDVEGPFRVENDVLTLPSPDGGEGRYARY